MVPTQREGRMKENRVKRILREGGLALGTHVGGIPDPQIVEIIGLAGFDAAFIDIACRRAHGMPHPVSHKGVLRRVGPRIVLLTAAAKGPPKRERSAGARSPAS